jgi:hypothetical protein
MIPPRLYTLIRGQNRILYREVSSALPCFPAKVEIVRVATHPLMKPLDPVIAWMQTPNKDAVRSVGFVFASGFSVDFTSPTVPLVTYLR